MLHGTALHAGAHLNMSTAAMECANITNGVAMVNVITVKRAGTVLAIVVRVQILGAATEHVTVPRHATNVIVTVGCVHRCPLVEMDSVMEMRTAIHALEIARSLA